MERLIVFQLLLVVFCLAVAAARSQQEEKLQLRDDGSEEAGECSKGQFFSLFMKQCETLPGVPAVDGKCPDGFLMYTYLGETRCRAMRRGATVTFDCPKGEFFSVITKGCQPMLGVPAVDDQCNETDVKFTYRGDSFCYDMTPGLLVPEECPDGQYFSPAWERCQNKPGIPAVDNKCPEEDVTILYLVETRCHPMPQVES